MRFGLKDKLQTIWKAKNWFFMPAMTLLVVGFFSLEALLRCFPTCRSENVSDTKTVRGYSCPALRWHRHWWHRLVSFPPWRQSTSSTFAPHGGLCEGASYKPSGHQASKQTSNVMDWHAWIHCKVEAGRRRSLKYSLLGFFLCFIIFSCICETPSLSSSV